MRLIKRTFVELVGVLTLGALAIAIGRAAGDASPAPLIASVPWLATATLIFGTMITPAQKLARTALHPRWFYAVAGATSALAFASDWREGIIAIAGVAAMLAYTLWYSRQHRPAATFEVGQPLPEFPLVTVAGERITSAALAHEPHVILFYRGNWCPFCMAQVKGIAEQYRELERLGVRVALISPQRAADSEDLSRRFDAPMDFYVDTEGAAARALDIVQTGGVPVTFGGGTNGDTVVPTIIITRADGTVAWIHHADNHRVRPEPSTFLEVIEREGIGLAGRGA